MDENKLLSDFNSEIDIAFRTAWHSEKGGNENWNNLLNSYGLSPLPQNDKQLLLNSEMKITRGAFPIELRRVYEKIIEKHKMNAASSTLLSQTLSNFDIDSKVLEYYQKIKPFAGLGDIFRNASTGTQKYSSGLQKEKQQTIKCRNCGAPRLEEMQYDTCLFCGSKLFETT
ncbi:MAG: hypothetical protein ABSF32_03450 [Ignavibacteria bacterium]|jgi:ribosomal protein L37E